MKYKYIFVDCFNTIIFRKKSPDDVIFCWAEKMHEKFSHASAKLFYYWFKHFERQLVKKGAFECGEADYTLQDILCEIFEELKEYDAKQLAVEKTGFLQMAGLLYTQAESENQYLAQKTVSLLRDFKNQGAKIFLVSDFYCGKETLKLWFEKLGILDIFDEIFVSCDYKKSKKTGTLYQYITSTFGLRGGDILMLGDNFHSDCKQAKRNGLDAKHLPAKTIKTKNHVYFKKTRKVPKEYKEIFKQFGKKYNFSNYAFPLYVFTKRLAKKLTQINAKDVFFLAREGKFMKELFDEFCKLNEIEITSHYLEVSRNSTMIPALKSLEEENFSVLLREVKTINIHTFLASMEFPESICKEISETTKLDFEKQIPNFVNSKEFLVLKQDKVFRDFYEKNRLEMRKAFETYLKSFEIDFEKDGMNIVDVGWLGTMQDFFDAFFEEKVDVKGFYIGCTMKVKPNQRNKKYGLLCNANSHTVENKLFHYYRLIYEQILIADCGRTAGYKLQNGEVSIKYDENAKEMEIYNSFVGPLQQQIKQKFVAICQEDKKQKYLYVNQVEQVAKFCLLKMLRKTSNQDVNFIINCEKAYFDNFARLGNTMKRGSDFFNKLRVKVGNFFAYIWFRILI